MNAMAAQNSSGLANGIASKFIPKKLVTSVTTRRIVATLVSAFRISFRRFEAAARCASMTLLVSSRNVSISSVTRTMWS